MAGRRGVVLGVNAAAGWGDRKNPARPPKKRAFWHVVPPLEAHLLLGREGGLCREYLHARLRIQRRNAPLSGLNERIEIGPYLTKLCASLAASMVGERRPLSIKVQATSGSANSSEAVSLGLIVTELVINALKHGFPSGEKGEILVKYEAQNSGWQLSVSDNGSGPQDAAGEPPHMGLGTSIVESLAHQLDGVVHKSSGPQGTAVTIRAGTGAKSN